MQYPVGPLEEFALGTIQVVKVGARSIGIAHTEAGLYAVLNVCPHALAPVCEGRLGGTMLPCEQGKPEYGLAGRILRCPWHGYEFDLADNGRSVFTDFRARVRLFPVSVVDGIVLVELKDPPLPQAERRVLLQE